MNQCLENNNIFITIEALEKRDRFPCVSKRVRNDGGQNMSKYFILAGIR